MPLPTRLNIMEVGPRDGLQNETRLLPPLERAAWVRELAHCGLRQIEAGAFVSPERVPQMAGTEELLKDLRSLLGVSLPVLVPNLKGLDRALGAGVRHIAIFAAASETFSRRNINCSIAESLQRYRVVCDVARSAKLVVRGYVSCVLGCPYEGAVDPEKVAEVAAALWQMGAGEISLGDTIGIGHPGNARAMVAAVARRVPAQALALHFHDTYGQALANIHACLDLGISTIDSAVGGLGGCPYAPGASGNVATEDVVYMLHGMGIQTGVDLPRLIDVSRRLCARLQRIPGSRVTQAWRS